MSRSAALRFFRMNSKTGSKTRLQEWLADVWSAGRASPWRMFAISALVGVIAGLGAVFFHTLLDLARWLMLDSLAGYREAGPGGESAIFPHTAREFSRWALFALPAAGGLLSGWLVYRFAPEAAGHGTDAAIRNFHFGARKPNPRLPWIKAIASAITIGSGGSGGREGPIAQIGSGFGALLGHRLGLSRRERRILMAAGIAGGVGAIFHAPMAGAIFAAEVLYRELDLEYEVIIPAIVSSVIAYAVFTAVFGWDPLFVTPEFRFRNAVELLPYLGLALVVALGATFYTRVFYAVHHAFERLHLHPALKPAIGGLLTGCVGLAIPAALATGYGPIQQALVNGTDMAPTYGVVGGGMLLAIAFSKTLTTAFSIGSGGSGGVFGPAIVVGGALGGAFGMLVDALFPALQIQTGSFVLVGMAGFFAAAANTPLSTVIMVSEMTGNYHLLVPSLWVCTIAYLLCRHVNLYEQQLHSRFDSPSHLESMMSAVLRRLTIADLVRGRNFSPVRPVASHTPFRELAAIYREQHDGRFALLDANGCLRGLIRTQEIRDTLRMTEQQRAGLIASDLAISAVHVSEDDTLLDAITQMRRFDLDDIIATATDDDTRILGAISYQDITNCYYATTRALAATTPTEQQTTDHAPRPATGDATLATYLRRDLLTTSLRATTREAVIGELLDLLASRVPLQDPEAIRAELLERESQISTGLEKGVAIPHIRTDQVDALTCVIGVHHEGIDFGALDGNPSHIFVLTLSPEGASAPHVRFMAAVCRHLDQNGRECILAADSPDSLWDALHASSPNGNSSMDPETPSTRS